jgi:DNA-binding NarL/FixJ family response regulator
MGVIRVVVANRHRLMRELIAASISDQPDIQVVEEIQDESGVEDAIDRTQPDFLIVTLDRNSGLPDFCRAVLQRWPQMKIIAIAPDRNMTVFYWASLQVKSNQIEPTETGVLNALRGIIRPAARIQ